MEKKKKTLTKKNQSGSQKGGNGRIIPKYIDEKNTPFKGRERKTLETKHYQEKNPYPQNNTQQEPLVEFKLSKDVIQKPSKPHTMYPSPYIPIQQPFPQNYPYISGAYPNYMNGMPHMYPWNFTPNSVPVIKKYNISLSNPAGDHVQISDLYEDMLPTDKFKNTSTSLEERIVIYDYVRSVLVTVNDGEDIDIRGKNQTGANRKNLFSYLKLLELNPYHNNRLTPNPYVSLPDRMLLYRSCYPIRYNNQNNNITCSRTSIGLNLRIYDMSIGELNASQLYDVLSQNKFDL